MATALLAPTASSAAPALTLSVPAESPRTAAASAAAAPAHRSLRGRIRALAPVLAFSASSASTSLLDTALFWLLSSSGVGVIAALVAARLVSCSTNFSINRWVVFRGTRRPLLAALAGYAMVAGTVLLLGIGLVDAAVALGVPAVAAKVMADLLLFSVSFTAQRFGVFRR